MVFGGPEVHRQPGVRGHAKGRDGCGRRAPSRRSVRSAAHRRDLRAAALLCRRSPLVIPSLNRDGDCLSDLVMQLFGSIAGAESVLLAFPSTDSGQTEAVGGDGGSAPRHRAAPGRQERRQSACDDPRRRRSAFVHRRPARTQASRAIYEAAMETVARRHRHRRSRRPREHDRLHRRRDRAFNLTVSW